MSTGMILNISGGILQLFPSVALFCNIFLKTFSLKSNKASIVKNLNHQVCVFYLGEMIIEITPLSILTFNQAFF